MKFFAKDFPEKLTSSILVSEVVAKKVKLKSHGKEYQGLCPFHNEKTPSFTVNDQKGFYHCFGCQAHGNAIDFVIKTQGLDFKDAVVNLANEFAIEIPWQESSKNSEKPKETNRNLDILEKICAIFQENLNEAIGLNARNYLKNRGFNKEIIKKFRLGFAIDSYDFLHQKLINQGFSEAEILKTGIIAKNNSNKIYDKFRNRVIFPIFDAKNHPIAFGGRVLDNQLPKYLNSSETEFFKKNQVLYNLSNAKSAIFQEKYAVIVEGYMDVLALVNNGVENVVAGLGTALSKEHFLNLFRITNRIILCLDGDKAGISAAKRASEIALPLLTSSKSLDFVFLPNNLDPDDYIKKFGAKSLKKLFEEDFVNLSQALFDFALIELNLDKKHEISPEEKAKIELVLAKKSELINDSLLKKYFTQFFKDILYKIGKNSNFNQKNSKNPKNLQNFVKIKGNFNKNPLSKNNQSDILAQNIIAFLLKFPQLVNYRDENFDIKEINFQNQELTDLKDEIIGRIEENQKNLLLDLENYSKSNYIIYIKSLLDDEFKNFDDLSVAETENKMRLLLLKNSLVFVQEQCQKALSKIDEINTSQTAVADEKITEIFSYKNSLELEILALEKNSI